MSEKRKVLPTKFATPQEDLANLPQSEAKDYSSALPEDSDPVRMHREVDPKEHVSQKIYLFPESYNQLRIYLMEAFPQLWKLVGGPMAWDAVAFIELMDAACDCKTTFDSAKIDAICARYLDLLRKKRGLSPLNGYTS